MKRSWPISRTRSARRSSTRSWTPPGRARLHKIVGKARRLPPSFAAWLEQTSPTMRWDWPHLRLLQAHLDQLTAGEISRLMVFMPPRHGKTEMATLRYPVYRLERDPACRVILGAYNQTLANP